MTSFPKTIAHLKEVYDKENHFDLPKHFWNTIDNLPNDQVFYFVERMLKIKGLLLGNDFYRVSNIQHQFRQYKTWTVKQKRSIVMDLIKNWYYVEFDFELY